MPHAEVTEATEILILCDLCDLSVRPKSFSEIRYQRRCARAWRGRRTAGTHRFAELLRRAKEERTVEEPALRGEPVLAQAVYGNYAVAFAAVAVPGPVARVELRADTVLFMLRMAEVTSVTALTGESAIDSTGIRMLRTLVRGAHRDGARVILVGVHAQPMIALGRADLLDEIGEADLCGTLDEALDAARAHLGLSPAPRTDPPAATAA